MPLAARGVFKSFRKQGRFARDGTFLHIQGTVPALLRREDIVRFAGSNELDILLPRLVSTRIGQPATDDFTGRHGIGIHSQRIGDTHPFGGHERLSLFSDRLHHFGQMCNVHLLTAALHHSFLRHLDVITSGIHPEQVGTRIAEVAFLAVQCHTLQCVGSLPLPHLFIRHIRYVFTDVLFHLCFRQAEIRQQPLMQIILPTIRRLFLLRVASRNKH